MPPALALRIHFGLDLGALAAFKLLHALLGRTVDSLLMLLLFLLLLGLLLIMFILKLFQSALDLVEVLVGLFVAVLSMLLLFFEGIMKSFHVIKFAADGLAILAFIVLIAFCSLPDNAIIELSVVHSFDDALVASIRTVIAFFS